MTLLSWGGHGLHTRATAASWVIASGSALAVEPTSSQRQAWGSKVCRAGTWGAAGARRLLGAQGLFGPLPPSGPPPRPVPVPTGLYVGWGSMMSHVAVTRSRHTWASA